MTKSFSNIFSVRFTGAAGEGVKTAGNILAKAATRAGLHVYNYVEYPSLIRGGQNRVTVNISSDPIGATKKDSDLELEISKISGTRKNIVAVGQVLKMLGGDLETVRDLLFDQFDEAKTGYDSATEQQKLLTKKDGGAAVHKFFLDGNEAVALGAISAGVQFAAIYPMSPISNIMHFLAAHQTEYGYIFKQAEDEIAAVNMIIGASFAGARAMTATSGGGYCLMTEGISLAGMTETPVVIINGMRGGPSTGLPTWSGQGDLDLVLGAGQGNFPRIVLAPGDVQEVFLQTKQAFYLAEKYQTPVTVLLDKNLCEHGQSLNELPNDQRPASNATRKKPGTGEFFIGNSYEHDDTGFTTEESEEIIKQNNKRWQKLVDCAQNDMPEPKVYGPPDALTTIVSWGSNKGVILEALKNLPDTNFLHLTWVNPFPKEFVKKFLGKAKRIINVEQNVSGQTGRWITSQTGIEIRENILKYDGRPFWVEEIVNAIAK
jgi:2-oxoglutarate ferredoxin oxidoreductase subunit alpha